MGKLIDKPHGHTNDRAARFNHLQAERRKLSGRLVQLDKKIARLRPTSARKVLNSESFDRWLDDMSAGLNNHPPLPADFSRADLYNDHD